MMTNILLQITQISQSTGIDPVSVFITSIFVIIFFAAWILNRLTLRRIRNRTEQQNDLSSMMKRTLTLSGNDVLMLNILDKKGYNVHGNFLPDEGITLEEAFTRIHPDDHQKYHDFIMSIANGEKKTASCIVRWDISGAEKKGDWRWIRDVGVGQYLSPAQHRPSAIFCVLTDDTERIEEEQHAQELTERYRRIFEQSIVGLAFYDKDGVLLTANRKMREILKFQSENDPYYFDNTIFDMPSLRGIFTRNEIEDLYFCTTSVILERGVNRYTELRIHPINDDEGQLIYITLSIRDVTEERKLYMQHKRNNEEMRKRNDEIMRYETELQYLMEGCDMRYWIADFDTKTITIYKGLTTPEREMTFEEYLSYFVEDDGTTARNLAEPTKYLAEPTAHLHRQKPIFHESDGLLWNYIDSVPHFDKDGQVKSCYGVIRNVTDLIEKQEQLKKETERANNSDRMKSVFMANMTHEIRTPLNSIVGFSDVLPMLQTAEEKQEIIRVIQNNCDMLLRLVNDILAASSLDQGSISIFPKDTDFAQTFAQHCETFREKIQNPQTAFIIENPYEKFVIDIDNERVLQIVTNFVTNAIKFTQSGHIRIGYDYREHLGRGGLYIYCEDTGCGIPKEQQERVFERFVKLNDYIQGTGLGLSISKAICESCQGKTGVYSEGEGTGSTFWAWIPCEQKEVTIKKQ